MLQITNTLTGKKAPWSPHQTGTVGLYVCGVTVYDHCHLGHARSAIVFDVIRRYLAYRGLTVRYVKNYTDIDDKILHRAEAEGVSWATLADRYIQAYEADMARLNVEPPTIAPRVTDHLPQVIQLIKTLLDRHVAYAVGGDIYFEVARFPDYGKLSKRPREEMQAGARVEIDPRKRDPLDFVLWKSAKPGEPVWESPWGRGRPGWHIECSAMSMAYLGHSFDLHGGGSDLIFPHHENEIAQSEAATGMPLAACWIHHNFVTVNTEKMSKSLGNFFTVSEVFEKSSLPSRVIAEVVRFYLLSAHYRSLLNFSEQDLKNAKEGLDPFYALYRRGEEAGWGESDGQGKDACVAAFEAAMDDDFNTPRALAVMQGLRLEINRRLDRGMLESAWQGLSLLKGLGKVLGLFQIAPTAWSFLSWGEQAETVTEAEIQTWVQKREEARALRDWKKADAIRNHLADLGIILEDRPDGTTRVKR